jgi:alpha-amylase
MSSENGVLFQGFHWYLPATAQHWNELAASAPDLAAAGFTAVWFPPCMKGRWGLNDVGYSPYDLFDLGEFDQKGSIPTKYGTRAELLAAIRAVQGAGMQAYGDVVHNHLDGADETEHLWVQEVERDDRNQTVGDWFQMTAWTRFKFAARANAYSSFQWYWWCFDALNYNADTGSVDRIYRLKNKGFSTEVSHEHGNYEYLLANDIDMGEEFVRGELLYWGRWFLEATGYDGFRLDAVKHIRSSWFRDWLGDLRSHFGRELFSVGEYWSDDVARLRDYLSDSGGVCSLFDVPLHMNFSRASQSGSGYDMRTLLDGTLVREQPLKAVTFVENHDTVPCQSLMSPVEPWFKPHAYALILLRAEGYPCVFHADYYGAEYPNCDNSRPPVQLYSHRFLIDRFLTARRDYGYGDQHDYFDHPNTIGWLRTGNTQHPGVIAVVMTNGSAGSKWMNTFRPGATFRDATGHIPDPVTADASGWANFRCPDGNVSVWLQQ